MTTKGNCRVVLPEMTTGDESIERQRQHLQSQTETQSSAKQYCDCFEWNPHFSNLICPGSKLKSAEQRFKESSFDSQLLMFIGGTMIDFNMTLINEAFAIQRYRIVRFIIHWKLEFNSYLSPQ